MTNASSPRTGRTLPLITAVAALCAVASPASAGTPINQRAAADPSGAVEISNVAGTVRVTGWDRNEVEVTGDLGEGTERLEFAVIDKVTRVKVILPDRSHNVEDTDLVVRIPSASRLAVTTVSADIEVQDVKGAQRLQTVSADIRTQAAAEDVECKSVSGDVAVNGAGQTLRREMSNTMLRCVSSPEAVRMRSLAACAPAASSVA